MAIATPEQPGLAKQDLDMATGYEQQFFDVLGPTAGSEAYLHMTALIELLASIPGPEVAEVL